MDKTKRYVCLMGNVLSLKRDECALIRNGSKITRTSTVVEVTGTKGGSTLFETLNSYYCVLAPELEPAVNTGLTLCA
jgi:hypothetical protein